MKKLYALNLFISLTFFSNAQTIFPPLNKSDKLRIEAVKAIHEIRIDGKLTDEDWSRCIAVKNFVQSQPNQGKPASFDTEVKILYDNKNIYIGAICSNPGNKIFVQDLRRDFLYSNNELFGVFLDPFQNVQNPVPSFLVTPYGTQRDLLIYDDRIYDLNWDAVWQAKSFITDSLWSTEIAIPWSTLQYPSDSTTWGINFNRNIRSLNEITGWSQWPMAYTVGRMSYAGIVTNLHPPKSRANIRIQPYGLLNATKTNQEKTTIKGEAGGEIKWLINTNTTLEGTVNTDFAQADVDKQVINLKRSSVFFPEKRQFFLENANLFAIGQDGIIQPFFSRRIGLDDNGNPLPINGGLRFIHQTGKRAIGAMFINQSDKDTSTTSWFGVIRGQQNVGTKGRVGALAAYKYDEITRSSNLVLSVDGFWHASEPLYIRPMLSATLPTNGVKGGFAFFNELSYVKNKILLNWLETIVTDGYASKTGFLARNNFINSRFESDFTFLTHWFNNRIRYFTPSIIADIFHTASDRELQEINITVTPFKIATLKSTTLSVSFLPSRQKLSYLFQPVPDVSISPGTYNFTQLNFNLSTNLSAPYSFIADATIGKFYSGKLNSYSLSARFVPIAKLSAIITYTYNRFYDFLPDRKVVETHLVAPELRLSINPKMQITGFYQYNTVSNLGGLNMRFAWEYKPLSFVYVVFNNLKTIDRKMTANPVNDQAGVLKISYIKQF
jgi:hypothetical protein